MSTCDLVTLFCFSRVRFRRFATHIEQIVTIIKKIIINIKTKVIPVIIRTTGTISKSFRKYVGNIPGKHEVKELQKTAILGTAHILRKVLI